MIDEFEIYEKVLSLCVCVSVCVNLSPSSSPFQLVCRFTWIDCNAAPNSTSTSFSPAERSQWKTARTVLFASRDLYVPLEVTENIVVIIAAVCGIIVAVTVVF